jgi:hypothetical protein
VGCLGGSLATMKMPMMAVILIEAPGAVGLVWTVKNRCGGERGEARVSQA